MSTFTPPIKDRTTKQLLQIAGSPDEWNELALIQAKEELKLRNIPQSEIEQSRYLSQKRTKLEVLKRAKESYSIFDFLLNPLETFFEVIVSWELRKDGFERKANQQQWLRPILILVIILIVIVFSLL